MPQYINRNQLQKATDEDIEKFFAETVFEGIYSSELKSKNSDFYKGSISEIKLGGRPTNLVGLFLNVPHNSTDIAEGPCAFKCRMNIKALREQGYYKVNLLGSSLTSIKKLTESNMPVSEPESKEQDLFDMWGVEDCQCIGYYHYDEESEVYIVDDLRKPNFDHIPYYPGDAEKKPIRICYPHAIRGIEENDYYLFTWKLSHRNKYNPYEIYLDFKTQPKPIDPKWFVDTLFNDRHNDKSKNFGSATNFLDTLSKQLSAKESTFVYELLQNANDYPVEGCSVDVEFHITDNYLLFLHSGDKFNVRNISGICGINEKEKVANKKTIGYKGIGFKTVFLNNHYVYLRTGDYSFRFDEGETPEKKVGGKIKRLEAPFQILPIWTKHNEVAKEVNDIFDKSNDDFRVQIALRPDNKSLLHVGKKCYENLFREVFSDSNIILFIPNINSVRVFINGKEECACFRNNEEWVIGDYESEISVNLQKRINKTIDKGKSRIPEKYKDFDYTKVSFACKHEGAIIKPVEDSILYCYLPTSTSWGLPFLMNTDMIPKGDRNDIEKEVDLLELNVKEDEIEDSEEMNFNEALSSIAGSKFFFWVRDLLTSRKYQLGSVFSLVPDFKKCKREHKDYTRFIEKFESDFNTCLETETIVPVPQGIALVNKVILDTTGLSTSGIMTDDEFRKFSGMEDYYLPLPMLRKDRHFNSFLKRYAEDDQIFDEESLSDLISNDDFKEWLKEQDNNNKFLNFLLENDYIADYFDESIFIEEECGKLFSASDLYYDIDEELKDLSAFSSHLCYLSYKTRDFFKDNEKWNEVIEDHFAEYDSESFINDTLLGDNWDETVKALNEWNTSFHFYSYLAKNNIVPDDLCSLPFFNDEGEPDIVDDSNDKFVFLSSSEGKNTCSASWLSSVTFSFVSPNYDKATLDYFKENAGVQDYSDDIIVNDIIQSEDYHDGINESQQENKETSVAFVKFCFEHESSFGSGSLRDYALNSYDCNGDEAFVLFEDHIYFPSECFDECSQRDWLNCDWMYSLDSEYLNVDNDEDKVKTFLKNAFYIEELDADKFYKDVVRPNISSIVSNTSGSEDCDGSKNLDFISFLDENYDLVFGKEKDYDIFKSFILIDNGDFDIESDSTYIYAYDSELKEILESEWFPADTVNMCSSKYGESKSILAIKSKKYDFANFFNDVITEELDNINDTISSKDASIAFHTFIIDRLADLTDKQKEVMKGAKVYLYGNDEASERSEGHHILSKSARELASMGLVEFSDLDIIDPDYHIEENEEYWKTRLENEQFTVIDFITWLTDNTDTFYSTIEDKENNLKFWRWVKGCRLADQTLENLPILPVYLTTDEYVDSDDTIYLSDNYIEEGGLETIVTSYHPDASFISSEYIEEDDNVEAWKDFWVKMGVRFEMVDILIDTIDNRLSETYDAKLPATIAKYRLKLEEHYDGDLISNLHDLRVKAHNGEFYPLDETIYIDCEKDEPFPYIELPNQITFNSADERRLIKDIINEVEGDCVSILSEWRQRKMDCYLAMQEDNPDSLRDFHFCFINDLSVIRNNEKDTLKEIKRIKEIKLLNKNNEFREAASLTMSSVYNPFFDFEGCGVETDYVSDKYDEECSEYTGKLFRTLEIHCDFKESDVEILKDRDCAIYFWSKYLTRKDISISRIKDIIDKNLLNNLQCIPTKDYMKSPTELYYGSEVSKYEKNIEDWENKIPLINLPDIEHSNGSILFEELPFKKSLDFLDGLYALISVLGQDRRTQILEWMIEDYDESYDEKILEYREDEHALWYNNKNEKVQIKDLYALNYSEKTLEQYFGQNPRIVNKAYFPGGLSFKTACDILGIQTISLSDLKMEPHGDMIYTQRNNDLRLFALVIAGMIDTERWQELYKGYLKKLESLVLHRCKSIIITYKEDETINQSLRKFYHETGSNDFYFVDSLDGKRVYTFFVKEFTDFIGIGKDDIPQEMIEDIMDSSANAMKLIREKNALMLDDDFKDALDELIPGIKRELNGKVADDDDEETPVTYRPTFTTSEPKDEDEDDNVGSTSGESTDDEPGMNDDYDYSSTNTTESHSGTESHDQSTGNSIDKTSSSQHSNYNIEENGPRKHRSDKGSTHDYPSAREPRERKSPTNTTTTRAGEGTSSYSDMNGWEGSRRNYTPQAPIPFSPEDVRNFGSHGVTRTLEVLEPTTSEVAEINRILGEDLSPEQVADQNYLAQLRLYNNLVKRGMTPNESKDDFVRNAHMKNEHTINGGKYIHKCSAAGGIMYLSPSIWNKIADDRCVVCVYLGAKSNEFMYFNSIDDILEWVGEDDIVIKLTGEEKADVVEELYSGVLNGVKGTAYTLIRINSNEKYNSLFAQLPSNNEINETEEDEDEY